LRDGDGSGKGAGADLDETSIGLITEDERRTSSRSGCKCTNRNDINIDGQNSTILK
jgi:hypothetical protein